MCKRLVKMGNMATKEQESRINDLIAEAAVRGEVLTREGAWGILWDQDHEDARLERESTYGRRPMVPAEQPAARQVETTKGRDRRGPGRAGGRARGH
jgi:hypothetical protein